QIIEENEAVNSIYPTIYDYKNKSKRIMDAINSLEAEKKAISKDKDMSSSEKSAAKKEINDELKDLYEDAKDLGMMLNDDRESFVIDELYLPVSMYGDLEKTSMYDKVLDLMNNGFLSLCLEEEEINTLCNDNLMYESLNVNSKNDFIDRVILSEYELNFFNFYNKDNYDMTTLSDSKKLEVEQLVSGKNVDKDNITSVIKKILAIREGCNIVYLYSSPTKRSEARGLANTLFFAFSPIVVEAMFIVILSSWALCQSFVDVYNIMHEKRVPFMHDDSTFSFDIAAIVGMSLNTLKENIGDDNEKGLNYVDYLRVLLLLNDQKVLNSRMSSIMQYNLKSSQEN
ncbi:MAG: DUF5702 domain-containing protein, partial [Lachnospiraceae bacterium]|nr:DUF5702 domain-containing protein [Lachnospiraceae bacterium]